MNKDKINLEVKRPGERWTLFILNQARGKIGMRIGLLLFILTSILVYFVPDEEKFLPIWVSVIWLSSCLIWYERYVAFTFLKRQQAEIETMKECQSPLD